VCGARVGYTLMSYE